MKFYFTSPLSFLLLLAGGIFVFSSIAPLRAQSSCTYTIQMFDGFGDGWNDGELTVISNGDTTTHSLLDGSTGYATFQVTDGAPIVIYWKPGNFPFEPSFILLNPDGIKLFSSGSPIPEGLVYSSTGVCPNCPSPFPNLVLINQVTDSSAFVNWFTVAAAESYFVEYGPQGYLPGTGLLVQPTSSNYTLTGLNPCVDYDVYIASYCGVDSTSIYIGPFSFQTTYTPPPSTGDTCYYTFEFFDGFGDGWNGAQLDVKHNGVTTEYTMEDGDSVAVQFAALNNLPIDFSYTPGLFDFEVRYRILDPNGIVVFSDGPYPKQGKAFSTIACPSCPGPVKAWMSDVNANNAKISWISSPDATGNYEIEYGPMGFTLGTGTVLNAGISQSTATLTGLQENTWYNAYIRLNCDTVFSKPVGPFLFHTLWLNDVGVTGITTPDPLAQCDLTQDETISVLLTNFGQKPQTLFEFYFAVNGKVAPIPIPQDGFFTGVIGNDSTQLIQFETTWDFSEPGVYVIEAWTVLEGDSNPANDTFRVQIQTAFPKPVNEDFEDNEVLSDWESDGFIYSPLSHNNETFVISDNLYPSDSSFTLTTGRIGPVEADDSLYFDYRYVNFFSGINATVLGTGNKLEVQISDDCKETFETVLTIDSTNHDTSTSMARRVILLDEYDGQAINIRFLATWVSGNYWIDLDNINVTGCPASLVLLGDIKGSLENSSTGSITVTPTFGTKPFSYQWNTGDNTATVDGLPLGVYEVTVTDARGCVDTKIFEVGIAVGTDEVAGVEQISLYPNPTGGRAFLDVALSEAMEVEVRVFNMNGQIISALHPSYQYNLRQELDLSDQPSGLYIVQIMTNGKPHYAKLMLTR